MIDDDDDDEYTNSEKMLIVQISREKQYFLLSLKYCDKYHTVITLRSYHSSDGRCFRGWA